MVKKMPNAALVAGGSLRFVELLESRLFLSAAPAHSGATAAGELSAPAVLMPADPGTSASGTGTFGTGTVIVSPPTLATGTVVGTVTDSTGAAVAGAEMRLTRAAVLDPLPKVPVTTSSAIATVFRGFITTTADSNGKYELDNVPGGLWDATANSSAGEGTTTVVVSPGQTATADITLGQGTTQDAGTVTGKVTDANGVAIAGASVTLLPSVVSVEPVQAATAFPVRFGLEATTDANGNFTLANVPVGSYVALASSSSGSGRASVNVTKDQTATVNITLQAAPAVDTGAVSGSVKDGPGNVVSGASVTLIRRPTVVPLGGGSPGSVGSAPAAAATATGSNLFIPFPNPQRVFHATTDAQGAFNIDQVPVGTYTLIVNQSGFDSSQQLVTVSKDQTTTADVTLRVTPPPAQGAGTLKGTVSDASGAGVPDALILLLSDPGIETSSAAPVALPAHLLTRFNVLHAVTDANGNFELDNVPAGDYVVIAAKIGSGFANLGVTIADGQTSNLSITLTADDTPVLPVKTVNVLTAKTKKQAARAAKAAHKAAAKAAKAAGNLR